MTAVGAAVQPHLPVIGRVRTANAWTDVLCIFGVCLLI